MRSAVEAAAPDCPVCRAPRMRPFSQIGERTYWACAVCQARVLDFRQRPSAEDETHVVFYRAETLRTLAAQRRWTCDIPVKDVALMHKPGQGVG